MNHLAFFYTFYLFNARVEHSVAHICYNRIHQGGTPIELPDYPRLYPSLH